MEDKIPFWLRVWQRLHIDFWLFIGLLAITAYGMLVLYSASGASETMFNSRIIQVLLGFIVMLLMAQFPPRFYQRIAPYLYLIGFVLLILVDVIGTTSKGAQRWLDLGFIRFQPSEIVKLAVPLMVAVYLGNRPLPPKLSETFIAIAMILLPTLLVAIQPDLGTSILVSASGLFVVFLAGMSWWLILAAVIGLAGFIPIMWYISNARLSTHSRSHIIGPRKRSSRCWLSYFAIKNCDWFWWIKRKRLDAGDSITIRIFARTSYRFYFCGNG